MKIKNNLGLINTTKLPNWPFNVSQLEGGYLNESLMVWLRIAAFPTFKKLYGRIYLKDNDILVHPKPANITNETNAIYLDKFYKNRLPKGDYFVEIDFSIGKKNKLSFKKEATLSTYIDFI